MTTTITRREIFKLSWEMARKIQDRFGSIREAFAHALRRVWAQVKALVEVEAEQKGRPVSAPRPAVSEWESGNVYRAAACARARARLGTFVGRAGW